MELEEFIEATLKQVISGIKKAQESNDGENVNARFPGKDSGGALIDAGEHGMFTRIDFDVAVSGENSAKGGINLKVFGVGVNGDGEKKVGVANRISFSVPVRIPDGDLSTAKEIVEKRKAARKKHQDELAANRGHRRRGFT